MSTGVDRNRVERLEKGEWSRDKDGGLTLLNACFSIALTFRTMLIFCPAPKLIKINQHVRITQNGLPIVIHVLNCITN